MGTHDEHVELWQQIETILRRERIADALVGPAAPSRHRARHHRRFLDISDRALAHAAVDAPDDELVDRLVTLCDLGVRDELLVHAMRATGRHRDGTIDRLLAKAGLSPQRRLSAFGLEPARRYRARPKENRSKPAVV